MGNRGKYFATCLGMDRLHDLADTISAKHVLFLVDACYSGLAASSRSIYQPIGPNYLRKMAQLRVRQIITAGRKDEKSFENPQWGHGAFTFKLLEALEKGAADRNDDGVITGSELGKYLEDVVPALTGDNQTPQFRYLDGEGNFLFLNGWKRK